MKTVLRLGTKTAICTLISGTPPKGLKNTRSDEEKQNKTKQNKTKNKKER